MGTGAQISVTRQRTVHKPAQSTTSRTTRTGSQADITHKHLKFVPVPDVPDNESCENEYRHDM